MILPAWFDDPDRSFSYKKVQFKTYSPPVKTSCPDFLLKMLMTLLISEALALGASLKARVPLFCSNHILTHNNMEPIR